MKSQSAIKAFKFTIIILMTLFCFACRKPQPSGGAGELTTNDVADPKTTGAENDKGLPYAGYNATQEISSLKSQIEDTEENRSFAKEIESAQVSQPAKLDPSVQSTDNSQATFPLDLKVQWKGIATPLDFQGNLILANGTYKSNMVEISGQRPDLNMTAECTDVKCKHGNFFVFDPHNRRAGIVVTNENRVLKPKALADPINPVASEQIPDELKKDQKVNISSMQVINGVSKFEIRNVDQDGQPTDLAYSGELVQPNGECPELKKTDKSSGALSSLCLKGYTGDGDFLLKGELKQPDSDTNPPPNQNPAVPTEPAPPPPTQSSGGDPSTTNPPPAPPAPPPAPVTEIPSQVHRYIYFQSTRADDTPEQVPPPQSGQSNNNQCPVSAKSDNFLIKDIMSDCNQPAVLDAIHRRWSKDTSLTRFLNSAANCTPGSSNCDSTDFNKMMAVLSQSELPQVVAFISLYESGFYPKSTSAAGAHGWWQFMPETGKGLSPSLSYQDLEDITKSTTGFVQFFTDQLKEWDGDFKMALISYNRGPGGAKVVETVGARWKTDPRIPSDLKEDYSIYKNFWDIQRYGLTKKGSVDLSYAPDVLGAIFAGTAPEAYEIHGYQGLEMK